MDFKCKMCSILCYILWVLDGYEVKGEVHDFRKETKRKDGLVACYIYIYIYIYREREIDR